MGSGLYEHIDRKGWKRELKERGEGKKLNRREEKWMGYEVREEQVKGLKKGENCRG